MENAPVRSPESVLTRINFIARLTIALVWIYHGLVPKIIYRDWSEMTLLRQAGVDIQFVPALLQTLGLAEIFFGVLVLAQWRGRWQLWATMGIMLGTVLGIARHSPAVFHSDFNPISLNGLMLAMAAIALISQPPRNSDPS